MEVVIIEKATRRVIGSFLANWKVTFDQAMYHADFIFVEGRGWTSNGVTFYNENNVEIVTRPIIDLI